MKSVFSLFKQVFSPLSRKETIFIQIAAYRDPELLPTLKNLLETASDNTRLKICIAWQHSEEDVWDNLDRYKDDPNVEFIFGVGGVDKKNSSSTILQNWKCEKTNRVWGHYLNFYKSQEADVKVKKLVLEPNQAISMQRHFTRSELWFVESGKGLIQTRENDKTVDIAELRKQDFFTIPVNSWHKLTNTHDKEPLVIIEIQYGEYCDESDIERL
jgi:mannose-6-phosphate isomerase-like protein (cupin superfamily)